MANGYTSPDKHMGSIMRELLLGRDVLSALPARPASAVFAVSQYTVDGIYIAVVRSIPAYFSSDEPPLPCYYADSGVPAQELFSMLKNIRKTECALLFVTPTVLLSDMLHEFALGGRIRTIFAYDADVHMKQSSRVLGTLVAACDFRSHLPGKIAVAGFMLDFTSRAVNNAQKLLGNGSAALFGLPCPLMGDLTLHAINTFNVPLTARSEAFKRRFEQGVIYCRTKETAEITYNALRAFFVSVSLYHSGLARSERKKAAADYAECRTRVLVCTYGYSGDIWNCNTDYIIFAGLPYDIPSVCRELITIANDPGEAIFVYADTKADETPTEQETELLKLFSEGITTTQLEWYLA